MTTQNTKEHTLYIRVPPVLKLAVSRAAAREGLSQNQYVQRVLEQATISDGVKGLADDYAKALRQRGSGIGKPYDNPFLRK